jgi:hypothetical protein
MGHIPSDLRFVGGRGASHRHKRKIIGELTPGSARNYGALHPGLMSFAALRLGSCRGVSLGIT